MKVAVGAEPITPTTCQVVAEAGQCMEGSVDRAILMAVAAKDAGCWGFKTQLLDPAKIATAHAPKYWTDTIGTATQREAFARAGLVDYGAWKAVKDVCDDIELVFLATPFDLDAVASLDRIGVAAYKIASGDITHRPLIEAIGHTGRPVILSTGASTAEEIMAAMRWGHFEDRCVVLACTLAYPTRAEDANLGRITTLLRHFDLVGYSDHTTGEDTALAAAAMGACMLEKHYTYDTEAEDVPDHAMALNAHGMLRYQQYAKRGVAMRGPGVISPTSAEAAAHHGARRSIYAAHTMAAGHRLRIEDMAFLRPGGYRSPAEYRDLIDWQLPVDVTEGDPL